MLHASCEANLVDIINPHCNDLSRAAGAFSRNEAGSFLWKLAISLLRANGNILVAYVVVELPYTATLEGRVSLSVLRGAPYQQSAKRNCLHWR